MRVLVACEFSGIVREAFRRRGHEALSCDLLPTEIEGPHYQGDILDLIRKDKPLGSWDLMIAHPPCTYLTIAGSAYYRDVERTKKREEATDFFKALQDAKIPRIAIENPQPFKSVMEKIGRYQQVVNPFDFGEPVRKKICLWLKNLPPLFSTNFVEVKPKGSCIKSNGRKYNYYHHQGKNAHQRSRFFVSVADAMAEQWGDLSLCDCEMPFPKSGVALMSNECPIHGIVGEEPECEYVRS